MKNARTTREEGAGGLEAAIFRHTGQRAGR